jgi:large subunit ribosomal protein L6
MSRIAKKAYKLPAGVSLTVDGIVGTVKGPKGEVSFHKPPGVTVGQGDEGVTLERQSNSKQDRASHGLVRRLIENAAKGVLEPYKRTLEIVGVGYQANVKGQAIVLKVGYANEIHVPIPDGVTVEMPSATRIVVTSCCKQKAGQLAAVIRAVRPPEPYNGKGIRYENEHIVRKAGKSFASGG